VYRHFPTKEALFEASSSYRMEELVRRRIVGRSGPRVWPRLALVFVEQLGTAEAHESATFVEALATTESTCSSEDRRSSSTHDS